TPLFDGWSLDAWLLPDEGPPLLPARSPLADQRLRFEPALAVETDVRQGDGELRTAVDVTWEEGAPWCRLSVRGRSAGPGWLALSVRPATPEGVSFVHTIEARDSRRTLRVNGRADVLLDRPA